MGQLNLLPFVGRETSTGKSAMMLRSWEIKTAWLIPLVDKWLCSWQVKLCAASLTRANPSALEMSIAHIINRYTN